MRATMRTPRRRAREFAVQGTYQHLMNQDSGLGEIITNIRDSEPFQEALAKKKPQVDEALFENLIKGMIGAEARYRDLIRPFLTRREEEVNPVEWAVLLMACHELAAMPETPYPVVINEAVEVAKLYGGNEGYKFINGIIDKLAVALRPDDPTRR